MYKMMMLLIFSILTQLSYERMNWWTRHMIASTACWRLSLGEVSVTSFFPSDYRVWTSTVRSQEHHH